MSISDIENAFDRIIFLTEINKETLKNSNCFIMISLFFNHHKNFIQYLEMDVANQKLKLWQKKRKQPIKYRNSQNYEKGFQLPSCL